MGILTETMTRLRDEVVSSRHARMALLTDLVRQTDERRRRVTAMCAGFAGDRAGAHRAWFGPVLSERQTGERQQRRVHVEAAKADAQAKSQPSATPKAESQRHGSVRPVRAQAAPPSVAASPQVRKLPFKKSKKR